MAKKKKRKEKEANVSYKVELIGVIFILASIIGIGRFGPVGRLISAFGVFLMGNWWFIFFAILIIIGAYMILKREVPIFLDGKVIGLFITLMMILTLSHFKFLDSDKLEFFKVMQNTVNNFLNSISIATITNQNGGGILGALISFSFAKLFDIIGAKIVTWSLFGLGLVMFTGVSIFDFIRSMANKTKKVIKIKPKDTIMETVNKVADEYEKDNKVVINSLSDLKEIKNDVNNSTDNLEEDSDKFVNNNYHLPPISILSSISKSNTKINQEAVKTTIPILNNVLRDFGIEAKIVKANIGPSVTQYELEVKAGTKVNKILNLDREIALALAAKNVHIQAPIPGKRTVGIEIPNKSISMVGVREILESIPKSLDNSKLLTVLGRNIMGQPQWMEINKTPHLLVAGSTGSGKSVCINSIITSILMRTKPNEVKIVLVDPKKVELSMYNGVPHLLIPVVTDPKKANIALKRMVVEMERRYDLFESTGTKNIAGYNAYIDKKNEGMSEDAKVEKLPYIVMIIDELADLMLVAAKEVEDSIMRITQMARAAGIHLIVATQRPSTDVITGVVKANIPSRISFAVSSSIDSRTILDMTGAEKLLGKGDMLFKPQGENTPIRIQGTFISDDDIKKVVDYTIRQQKAHYNETFLMDEQDKGSTTMVDNKDDYDEPLYNEIVEFVVREQKASASLLQRRFRLGYNRAARCIDLLEERGIIGPNNGSKPREVLIKLNDNSDLEK